jgi:DNA-directed RNA polymerase sigma subunit (sigma70/sigma32)
MAATFQTLHSQLDTLRRTNRLHNRVTFDLAAQMRKRHVTIRQLAEQMDVTQQRVRQVRAARTVPFLTALDYQEALEAITRGRKLAMAKAKLPAALRPFVRATEADLDVFLQAVR